MKITFKVTLYLTHDISVRYLKNYIREALKAWAGTKEPDDSIFANITKITVKPGKDRIKKDKFRLLGSQTGRFKN